MPHTDQNPADEVFDTATQRLLALLAETMATSAPNSLLAYKSAYAFSRLCKASETNVDEEQVRVARKIVARISDLIDAAPANERGNLRTARHTFESLIDQFEIYGGADRAGLEVTQFAAGFYIAGLDGGAGSALDAKVEG